MKKRLKAQYGCPVEFAVEFLGGKWKTVILARLKMRPQRYGELRASIPGLSDKVLSERLKELEALGLVEKCNGGKAAAVYRLTRRAEAARPVLTALYDWGSIVAAEMRIAVEGKA